MRKIVLGTTLLSFALVSMAFAGAKDKTSNTVVDINATGVLDNTLAKTKIASKKPCQLQVQMQTLSGLSDGDVVICLAEADTYAPIAGGNSVVIAAEVKSGKINLKANLAEVDIAGLGCGDVDAISYNGGIKCYLDDPTYRGDANVPGSWRASCPFLKSAAPGITMLKDNPTQPIVVGICQGAIVGNRITPPPTAEFARTGQRTPIIVP
jgi:hypothetical protein